MKTKGKTKGSKRWLILALAAVALVGAALAWIRVGPAPEIVIEAKLPGIGRATPIVVRAAESQRGLSGLRVELVQGNTLAVLAERHHRPRPFWAFWGPRTESEEIAVAVGSETVPDLVEGEATAHYIAEMAKARQIRVTRIAHGVPLGSELEYMDGGTLSHAFAWRTELE